MNSFWMHSASCWFSIEYSFLFRLWLVSHHLACLELQQKNTCLTQYLIIDRNKQLKRQTLYFKDRFRGAYRSYNISVCVLLNSFDSGTLGTNNKTDQLQGHQYFVDNLTRLQLYGLLSLLPDQSRLGGLQINMAGTRHHGGIQLVHNRR